MQRQIHAINLRSSAFWLQRHTTHSSQTDNTPPAHPLGSPGRPCPSSRCCSAAVAVAALFVFACAFRVPTSLLSAPLHLWPVMLGQHLGHSTAPLALCLGSSCLSVSLKDTCCCQSSTLLWLRARSALPVPRLTKTIKTRLGRPASSRSPPPSYSDCCTSYNSKLTNEYIPSIGVACVSTPSAVRWAWRTRGYLHPPMDLGGEGERKRVCMRERRREGWPMCVAHLRCTDLSYLANIGWAVAGGVSYSRQEQWRSIRCSC